MDEKRFIKYINKKLPVPELISSLDSPFCDLKGSFKIKAKHLIKICNDYLEDYIDSTTIVKIASDLIISDYFEWDSNSKDGERISETLFDWDNTEINFEINRKNIGLWREYLNTGMMRT